MESSNKYINANLYSCATIYAVHELMYVQWTVGLTHTLVPTGDSRLTVPSSVILTY